MTLEEVSATIAPLVSIQKIIQYFNKKESGKPELIKFDLSHFNEIVCIQLIMEQEEGEERVLSHPKSHYEIGNIDEIKKLYEEEKIVIFFNPWALNSSLIRWITMEPSNPITKNLVFSATGLVISDKINDAKGIFSYIEANILQVLKKKATRLSQPARQAGSLRRRMTERANRNNYTYIDVSVTSEEYGSCRYSCTRKYTSMHIDDDDINEVRDRYVNEGSESAQEYLKNLVAEGYYNGDADRDNYEYDDYEPDDEELQYDDTNYEEIVETLTEE